MGDVEGGEAEGVLCRRIGLEVKEGSNGRGVTKEGRFVERGLAFGIAGIDIPTGGGQVAQTGNEMFEVKVNVQQGGDGIRAGSVPQEDIGNLKMGGVADGHYERGGLLPDGIRVLPGSQLAHDGQDDGLGKTGRGGEPEVRHPGGVRGGGWEASEQIGGRF